MSDKTVKKIVFITGTRADYGKLKPLIRRVEESPDFEAYIYVSGMHLIEVLGDTYEEVLRDGYKNTYVAYGLANTRIGSYDLGNVICDFTGYALKIRPDLIVVHGDRIDALAGAVVGALNNICVAHIEGGELSGTIDESIRHAISNFAHIHLVSNEEAKKRLCQLGEIEEHIFVIGSPDIDIMLSDKLPDMKEVKRKYEIGFDRYSILMYHPVTTEYEKLAGNIRNLTDAVIESNRNYVVIYPNNDLGYELILNEYNRFKGSGRFRIFPSLRFEYFLTLLKNSDMIIGNSSAGVREAAVYGIPAIDIGTRQSGRYDVDKSRTIVHMEEDSKALLDAIDSISDKKIIERRFGDGNSAERFINLLNSGEIWNIELQKRFNDLNWGMT